MLDLFVHLDSCELVESVLVRLLWLPLCGAGSVGCLSVGSGGISAVAPVLRSYRPLAPSPTSWMRWEETMKTPEKQPADTCVTSQTTGTNTRHKDMTKLSNNLKLHPQTVEALRTSLPRSLYVCSVNVLLEEQISAALSVMSSLRHHQLTRLKPWSQSTDYSPAPGDVSGFKLQTPHLTLSHTALWVRKEAESAPINVRSHTTWFSKYLDFFPLILQLCLVI